MQNQAITAKCATHKLTYLVINGCSKCPKVEAPKQGTYHVKIDYEIQAFSSDGALSMAKNEFAPMLGKIVSITAGPKDLDKTV